jgi:broad specificity phosphatase PhoE
MTAPDTPPNRSRRLLIVRHAQSEHHVLGLTGGWTDTGLTDLGHEQARRLAARLAAELAGAPIRLYTSELRRAAETAGHIAAALGVEPVPDPRLREHNNGAAAGLTHAEAVARFPDSYARSWDTDMRPFPGAETWREFHARTSSFMEALPVDGPMPLLVTHGGTLMNLIAWWLRLEVEALQNLWFGALPASVTVLQADDGPGWSHRGIERLSDIAHLQDLAPIAPLRG